ncbi:hypothetical protein M9Y10_040587 [Tritrichomonas musculus]|uniref:Inosine/uridine-preferring nucleoside hydrolase domain-containing protein n=1 Tax=Tritrichomonas musculus TaxID=1915356 RepID=A0ABR2GQB5_9EUKA
MIELHHHKSIPPSLEEYPFADRNVPYGTEIYEPSPEELNKIKNNISTPVSPHKSPTVKGIVKCIIDTDIGTDFDDTLALLYALNLENLEILGITTNYGPTQLRSLVTHKIVDSYLKYHPERNPIPIISGANFQLGTHREIFIKGNEGRPFINTEEFLKYTDDSNWENNSQTVASEFIAETINSNQPGTVTIISIGIMTNIALAFQHHPEIVQKVKEIVVMGGGSFMTQADDHLVGQYTTNPKLWSRNIKEMTEKMPENKYSVLNFVCEGNLIHLFPNHNLSGDTMAAVRVFSNASVPMKIICHSVTSRFWLEGRPIQFFHDKAREARLKGKIDDDDVPGVVGLIMEEWFKRRNGQNGQCPHDPLTVHEAAFGGDDSPVYYVNGTFIVHEWAAFSTFIPNKDGKHLLGIHVDQEDTKAFLEWLGRRLTNNYKKENDKTTPIFLVSHFHWKLIFFFYISFFILCLLYFF